jgi:tryptophan halogenase
MTDQAATELLLQNIDGAARTDPRVIKFKTGRREKAWHKNCVSLGLASGFLEPLESTSIHMVQTAVTRLIKMFPHKGIKVAEIDEYNRQTKDEMEHIRDFIILHYAANQRPEPFWMACAEMSLPESLSNKISLFKQAGKTANATDALFSDVAWQQVMIGQGLVPEDYHPLANSISLSQLSEFHGNIKTVINQVVSKLPTHQSFIDSLVAKED